MRAELHEGDSITASVAAAFGWDTAAEVVAELRLGWEREKVMARIEQRRIADSVRELGARRPVEGLGAHTHSVSLTAYLYWHTRTNGECWKDPAFWEEFGRDNPETKVAYEPKARIVHPGWTGSLRGGRVVLSDEPEARPGAKIWTAQGSSAAERRIHNPEAGGSTPSPATKLGGER